MAESPIITVAFPIYNPGKHLFTAISSILSQTFEDFEVLLIDDGSDEDITNKLRTIEDRRIRIIKHNKNKGLAYRLNEAVTLAQGKYIARMDQDDISSPERFQVQYNYLEKNPEVDLVATRCITINEEDDIIGALKYTPDNVSLVSKPWQGFCLPHPTWMGKAKWFKANPYAQPDPYRCQDQELILRTYKKSNIKVIPQYLLAYRKESRKTYSSNAAKTAYAVYLFQIRYFWAAKERVNILLCTGVLATKTIRNIVNPVISLISKKMSNQQRADNCIEHKEQKKWQSIIYKTKRCN